jgi:hypothetical protein
MASANEEISDYFFDGCSSIAPEGTPCDTNLWCDCCFTHDKAYWEGGSWTDRRNADLELMSCVSERSGIPALGLVYYLGVRAGGSPYFNTDYRWGFGWDYGRGYTTMSAEERAVAEEKFEQYMDENPDPCSEF